MRMEYISPTELTHNYDYIHEIHTLVSPTLNVNTLMVRVHDCSRLSHLNMIKMGLNMNFCICISMAAGLVCMNECRYTGM